jgi:putative DNA primase/helicase
VSGESLTERARGRWRSMLPMLGVDSRHLTGKHGPCPMCGGKDRFRFDDKEGKGTWICSQCGAGDGFALAMRLHQIDFKEVATRVEDVVGKAPLEYRRRDERSEQAVRDAMNRLWGAGNIVQPGDLVSRYLEARGISLAKFPAALRHVEKCRYQAEPPTYYPAMIAKVAGPDGKPVTLHRTYLSDDGAKAAVSEPRKLMPAKLVNGCAIRLCEPGPVLGIAEGIETALSASIIWSVPCWAAINAAMLMKWDPPQGASEVIIFGDNDPKYGGQSAAYALAHRLAVHGTKVRVEVPDEPGTDWNDMLRADRQVAA